MAQLLDENTQFEGTDGKPIVNGFVYIGTQGLDPVVNPASIFAERALTTPLTNPQRTDSQGRVANKIWVSGKYSIRVDDLDNVQQFQDLDAGSSASLDAEELTNVQGINALTAEGVLGITSYVDKQQFVATIVSSNTSTTVTLNIDSVGVKSVTGLAVGTLKAGEISVFIYNSGTDAFTVISGVGDAQGPASSVLNQIASYADTSGKILKDSGLLSTSVVLGPSSVTDGAAVAFDGTTGKLIKAATVSGKILQVIQATKTDTQDATPGANTYGAVTGMTATITPSSTSSKILVTGFVSAVNRGDQENSCGIRIKRDATIVGNADSASSRVLGNAMVGPDAGSYPFGVLDSPASTSALSYTIELNAIVHTGFYVNRSIGDGDSANIRRNTSQITVMEIGA